MDSAAPTDQAGIGTRRWRIFCRVGILLNPFVYFYALARTQPQGHWLDKVVMAGLVLQLLLPLGLLVLLGRGPRRATESVILDFSLVLLGWLAGAAMVYFLVVYIAAHGGS